MLLITLFLSSIFLLSDSTRICKNYDDKKDLSVLVKIIDDLYSLPYRIAGTPQSLKAVDYVRTYFKSIGLQNVTDYNFTTNLNIYPLDSKTKNFMKIVDNKTGEVLHTFNLEEGLVPGRKVPSILLFSNVTYFGRDIKFNEQSDDNSTSFNVKFQAISETSEKDELRYPEGTDIPTSGFIRVTPSWNPDIDIPFPTEQLIVKMKDAEIMETILESNNESMLSVMVNIPYHKNVNLTNVCAKLPGVGWLSHRSIIFGAHRDTVGPGAIDNGSGHSVMQYLAFILSKTYQENQQNTPRRTAYFCSWDGEEAGLLGSQAFVKDFRKDLSKHLDAYINIDTVLEGTEAIVSLQSATLNKFVESILNEVVGESQRNRSIINKISTNQKEESYWQRSDHYTFTSGLNIPVMSFTYSAVTTFRLYHTVYEDIHYLHTMDRGLKALQKIIDCYLCVATNLLEKPMLPLDKDVLFNFLKNAPNNLKENLQIQAKSFYNTISQLTTRFQRKSNFTAQQGAKINKKLNEINNLIVKLDNAIRVRQKANSTFVELMYNEIHKKTVNLEKYRLRTNN